MFNLFKNYPELVCGFSSKEDGDMKLISANENDENRQKFFNKCGIDEKNVVSAELIREDGVKVVTLNEAGTNIENTDSLITNEKDLFLAITVADCLAIYIYDTDKKVVALVHAGWQGLTKNIVKKTVTIMKEEFGTELGNLLIGISPSIGVCHFEVKDDVLPEFKDYLDEVLLKKDNKMFIDLKKLAKIQLVGLGVEEKNIEIVPECTYCLDNKYFSYRRDKNEKFKTMVALFGIKKM